MMRYLHDMLVENKPSILALVKTRVSSVHAKHYILNKTYLTNILAVQAVGFAGGIWLMWDATRVTVDEVAMNEQIITVIVHDDDGFGWFLSLFMPLRILTTVINFGAISNSLGRLSRWLG